MTKFKINTKVLGLKGQFNLILLKKQRNHKHFFNLCDVVPDHAEDLQTHLLLVCLSTKNIMKDECPSYSG